MCRKHGQRLAWGFQGGLWGGCSSIPLIDYVSQHFWYLIWIWIQERESLWGLDVRNDLTFGLVVFTLNATGFSPIFCTCSICLENLRSGATNSSVSSGVIDTYGAMVVGRGRREASGGGGKTTERLRVNSSCLPWDPVHSYLLASGGRFSSWRRCADFRGFLALTDSQRLR